MKHYQIADLVVALQVYGKILARQSRAYISNQLRPYDISISLNKEFFLYKHNQNPNLSLDECEYIWTGAEFYHQLLDFNGMMLHASALAYEEKAYLFSAPCGTGKSTHARLWCKHFGFDRAVIINDDKPAIRLIDDHFYVYGTPWSGKSDYNLNVKMPLQAICFLEQAPNNWIKKLDRSAALKLILYQTLRPLEMHRMSRLLELLDRLLKDIPVYKMGCDISEQAVTMAYQTMSAQVDGKSEANLIDRK